MSDEKRVAFLDIGDADNLPYQKVDITKASRIGENYVISFYQVDYQAMVNALTERSKRKPEDVKPMPVIKVVMDRRTFDGLLKELNDLKTKVEKRDAK
jgi:hypothetical protein